MRKQLGRWLAAFGISPSFIISAIKGLPYFYRHLNYYKRRTREEQALFPVTSLYPCLADRFDASGATPLHYFYQDLYVASRVFENNPAKHIDIGSRFDGFVAHIASFRKVEVFDIRPLEANIHNVSFVQADLMQPESKYANYCDSLSCLHALEHFGIGRYGDPLDPSGHLKGFASMSAMIQPGGRFYFSTPMGPQRIEFDAHRVFSLKYLLDMVSNDFTVFRFSYITDDNVLHTGVELTESLINTNCGCTYGCAIFELIKK